jgi:hypothetical protein
MRHRRALTVMVTLLVVYWVVLAVVLFGGDCLMCSGFDSQNNN